MRAWEELQKLCEHAIDAAQTDGSAQRRYFEIYRRYYEWAEETENDELRRWFTERSRNLCPTMRDCMEVAALRDVLRERGLDTEKPSG